MASNHPLLAMLLTHLFTPWASHMGGAWIESCVFAFAILHLSRSFPVKLRLRDKLDLHAGDHVWSTWSCDIWIRLSYIIRNFFWGGGEDFGYQKQFKKISKSLKRKWKNGEYPTFWQHFRGKNVDKTFLLTYQETRSLSTHKLQQCLEHFPPSTINLILKYPKDRPFINRSQYSKG